MSYERRVRHVGLGQQDVHVAGHPSGDRMDRVLHLDAALLELIGEFAHAVLRLRDRHAVAGHDDDLIGVRGTARDVVGGNWSARLSGGRRAAAAVLVWIAPKAPKSTLVIERFIALPISSVSSVPEAPTSAPEMISTLFSSTKPVAAAARPVKELSSEMTTGMSAPPIGSTKSTPRTSAARSAIQTT